MYKDKIWRSVRQSFQINMSTNHIPVGLIVWTKVNRIMSHIHRNSLTINCWGIPLYGTNLRYKFT